MIKVLFLTIGLKALDVDNSQRTYHLGKRGLLDRLTEIQCEQAKVLDEHLKTWSVLHVTDIEDKQGWHSAYTLHKPDLMPQPLAVESENQSLDLSALNGDGVAQIEEFEIFRRGYVAAREVEDDSTC